MSSQLCAHCLQFYEPTSDNEWLRQARRYCSPKCRLEAQKARRRDNDRRISIDAQDIEDLRDLRTLTGDSVYNLVRKCLKIVLTQVRKGNITPNQLKNMELENPGGST